MKYNIITINREFASCGSEIAQQVAQRLHITYVDKFLITRGRTAGRIPSQTVSRQQTSSWPPALNTLRPRPHTITPLPALLCPPLRRSLKFSLSLLKKWPSGVPASL